MEMTVGESLIGGCSAAVSLGAEIEELARRAAGTYSEIERCSWWFGDMFGRAAGTGRVPGGYAGGAEGIADRSADREVSEWDRGANGSSDKPAVFGAGGAAEGLNYSAVLEKIVFDALRTGGAANGLYERSGTSYASYRSAFGDDILGGSERDILESCVRFGNGMAGSFENSERSAWFNGAAEDGYLNVLLSAEDLYYGLGGTESGLPAPPEIGFGAVVWEPSSSARFETAGVGGYSAADGLMVGDEVRAASSLPRVIGSSGYSETYGALNVSSDELISLRSCAARSDITGAYPENAEISADGGSEFFGSSEFFGGEGGYAAELGHGACGILDYDDIIDHLVSGVKNALESGAEGVFS